MKKLLNCIKTRHNIKSLKVRIQRGYRFGPPKADEKRRFGCPVQETSYERQKSLSEQTFEI